jgi:HSP20 family protein
MMQSVEEAIQRVEHLYTSVTGAPPPVSSDRPYAPIPPEKDPSEYVEESMARLAELLAFDRGPWTQPLPAFAPAVDLLESDSEYVVAADLPGVERNELEVALAGQMLTVSGMRSMYGNGVAIRRSERPHGRFVRQVLIPTGARVEDATARLHPNGVLEVRIPKGTSTHSSRRTIEIL